MLIANILNLANKVFIFFLLIDILFGQDFIIFNEKLVGSNLQIKMMPIKGGKFSIGSPTKEKGRMKDESLIENVKISDFWMSELEITWDLYELFLDRKIDQFKKKDRNIDLNIDAVSGATAPYVNYNKKGFPVINVTQYAASQFCKWLTAKTGNYYRLPTEAEWEYACRSGEAAAYSYGKQKKEMVNYGWYKKNSEGKIQKGRLKKPNKFGLYDMHGNVAEWVLDSYEPQTYIEWGDGIENPIRKGKKLYPRVVRGGSFKDDIYDLRSAARGYSTPLWKQRDPQIPKSLWWFTDAKHIGFRIVRPRTEPKKESLDKMWVRPKKEY